MFLEEVLGFEAPGKSERRVSLEVGGRESKLRGAVDSGDVTARTVKWKLDRFRTFHFHDTSASAPIQQARPINDNRYLERDGGNLAPFLYLLRERYPASYSRVVDLIRRVAPFFDDFSLEPDRLNPNNILLEWQERGSGALLYPHQLSDGTLRFMALATLLNEPEMPNRPESILIDEPELGLHPYAIGLLADMIHCSTRSAT